jgi:acetolactate synthase-1/2/3 large subunit
MKKIVNVSDHLFYLLNKYANVKDVFTVSGGGIMFLTEALRRNKKIKFWINYGEQSSCIAAEAYSKLNLNSLGVCLVTTGPGSTNALSGLASAWVDSVPLIVISGQVRTKVMCNFKKKRQKGPQEINIIPMVKPISKYAKTITKPHDIEYEVLKAINIAKSGRPGPVWLNIPLDVQSAKINKYKLKKFNNGETKKKKLKFKSSHFFNLVSQSKKPLILAGNGVKLSNTKSQLAYFLKKNRIPVVTNISAMDLFYSEENMFYGNVGINGNRHSNIILQNCDLLIILGSEMSISCMGYNRKIAPFAKKIMVNIDKGAFYELGFNIDLKINLNLIDFFNLIKSKNNKFLKHKNNKWINFCNFAKKNYSSNLLGSSYKQKVEAYAFYKSLNNYTNKNDIIVFGNNVESVVLGCQSLILKKFQKTCLTVYYGSMGWDLPAAFGASICNPKKQIILLTGDGSIIFNIQELLAISNYNLNIKIIIFNNKGYQSIKRTQKNFFKGEIGADKNSGVFDACFSKISKAYGIKYISIKNNRQFDIKIESILKKKYPCIIDLNSDKNQKILRVTSYRNAKGKIESHTLDNMKPFLKNNKKKLLHQKIIELG